MEIWIHHFERDEPIHLDSETAFHSEVISALLDKDGKEMREGYKYTVHVTVSDNEQSCTSEIIDMRDDAEEIIEENKEESRYEQEHRRSFSQPSSIQGW